jgi:Flp pilus assembly protein TadG
MKKLHEQGVTTVEFAIVGLVALVILFSLIEFSRLIFVINSLSEATRRGARMAAVCPLNDPAILQVTVFNAPGGGGSGSPIVSGLDTSNVVVEYLDQNGQQTNTFAQIQYVRVRIANFQHTLLIPVYAVNLTLPEYPTTLPRESLGIPRQGTGPLPCAS